MDTTKKSAPKADVAALSATLMGTTAKPQLPTSPAEKKVANRAGWTGVLTGFGLLTMGVKSFKATEEEKVSLNKIYVTNPEEVAKGAAPVYAQLKQGAMVGVDGKAVAPESILSGYKFGEDEFVTISEDEKKSCMVSSDKKMEITEFVPATSVDSIYFDVAEYIAPEKGYEVPFALLRKGMVDKNVVAIAQSNQRGREQTLVLRPYGENGMTAHYMYFDNEVRSFEKWTTVNVTPEQAEVAGLLIDALTADTFDPTQYSDGYIRSFKGLINNKIQGNAIAPAAPVAAPVADAKVDVMAMLAASMSSPKVAAMKAKRTAKKAMAAVA
jgi:DNA end-binding protein Ku